MSDQDQIKNINTDCADLIEAIEKIRRHVTNDVVIAYLEALQDGASALRDTYLRRMEQS